MIAAGFFLYSEMTMPVSGIKTEKIGTITFRKEYAERKYTREVIWQELEQNSPVYNFDSIRTVKNSAASIHLNDGTVVDLEENTLVLVSVDSDNVDIELSDGSIFAESGKKDSAHKLNILASNIRVAANGASVNISKKGDNLKLDVANGNVSLAGKKVKAGQLAVMSGKDVNVKNAAVRDLSPENNHYAVSGTSRKMVVLSWKMNKTERVFLEVSRRYDFKKRLFAVNTAEKSYTHNFSEGVYYWRVSTPGSDNYVSPVNRLIVVCNAAPVITEPVKSERYSYRKKLPLVRFRWKGKSYARNYLLQISAKKNFSSIIAEKTVRGESLALDSLKKGDYYCRVGALYPYSKKAVFSRPQPFKILRTESVSSPSLIFTPENRKGSIMHIESQGIVFNWSSIYDAEHYIFELAKDRGFKKNLLLKKTNMNSVKIREKIPEGDYYWRVRAVASDGTESRPSKAGKIRLVKILPLRLISPADRALVNYSEAGTEFLWSDPNRAGSYIVEIFRDIRMKNLLHKIKSGNRSVSVKGLSAGEYYWRVMIDGKVSSAVKLSSFNVIDNIDSPEGLYPAGGNTVDLGQKKSLIFKWKPVRGAASYTIELFYYKGNYKKRIFTTSVNDTRYTVRDYSVLDTDTYFWQVKALKKHKGRVIGESPYSRKYFRISLGEKSRPEKIDITSPKVIYVD